MTKKEYLRLALIAARLYTKHKRQEDLDEMVRLINEMNAIYG